MYWNGSGTPDFDRSPRHYSTVHDQISSDLLRLHANRIRAATCRLTVHSAAVGMRGPVLLALEILVRLFSEVVGADIGGRARVIDHVRIGIDADRFQEGGQADPVHRLADALVLERVLGEELDQLACRTPPASR